MAELFRKFSFLAFLVLSVFLFSGCTSLKAIDKKLGEIFFNSKSATSTNESKNEKILDFIIDDYTQLTKEQKEKIDEFLKQKGLNRYGDQLETDYIGGTPLFNEQTGESIDRFEYILENHPDLFVQ